MAKKDFDTAIKCYKKVLFLDPTNPRYLEEQAQNYASMENYEMAILHFKKAYRLSADDRILQKLNTMLFNKGLEMIQ